MFPRSGRWRADRKGRVEVEVPVVHEVSDGARLGLSNEALIVDPQPEPDGGIRWPISGEGDVLPKDVGGPRPRFGRASSSVNMPIA